MVRMLFSLTCLLAAVSGARGTRARVVPAVNPFVRASPSPLTTLGHAAAPVTGARVGHLGVGTGNSVAFQPSQTRGQGAVAYGLPSRYGSGKKAEADQMDPVPSPTESAFAKQATQNPITREQVVRRASATSEKVADTEPENDTVAVNGFSSFIVGLAMLPYVCYALYSAFGVAAGNRVFDYGPYGLELISYIVTVGLSLWSFASFVTRGMGLPAGVLGLFGLAEGLSYLGALVLLVAVGLNWVRGSPDLEFKPPEFKAPEFKAPDIKAPAALKVPDFKAPDLKAPDFKAPDFKAPDFKVPDFKAPDFKVPEFKAPDFKVPDVTLPKVPDIKIPDVKMPDVKVPEIKAPELPASKPEPKAPEPPPPKPAPKPEAKPEAKPAPKVEPKPAPKEEKKPEAKPAPKAEAKPASQPSYDDLFD